MAIALFTLDGDLRVEHDSGIYIILSKALATGQGYREIFLVGNPLHTKYPPLFPLLLEPLVYVFGYHFVAMKLLVVAFAVGALFPLYILCRDLSDDVMASLVVIATVTSPGILHYSHSIMTEMPYLFFSFLALYWLHKCAIQGTWSGKSVAIAVALIPVVYLTRLLGLSLLVAAVAYLLVDGAGRPGARIRRAIVLGGLAAIPAVIWFLHNWWMGEAAGTAYWSGYGGRVYDAPSAIDSISILSIRLMTNLYKYALHSSMVVFFYLPSVLERLLLVPLAALIFGGFLWRAVRKRTVLEYYVLFYMCSVLLFPGTRPQRYLVPLIPFLWYYFLTAVYQGLSWLHKEPLWSMSPYQRGARLAVQLLFVLLVTSNGAASVVANVIHQGREDYYHTVGEEGYIGVTQWVGTHTTPESVFIWAKPALRFLWTGRKAVDYPRTDNAKELLEFIHLRQVNYVVVDAFSEKTEQLFRSVVEHYSGHFSLVYSNDVSQVYKVIEIQSSQR